jgi:hypothetical protein
MMGSSGMVIHASAHMSQILAHMAHISADMGERRIIMSAHMRVISEQSMTARMICMDGAPPICMQALMASSHALWQAMQALTHSCISLVIAGIDPDWLIAPPRSAAGLEVNPQNPFSTSIPVCPPAGGMSILASCP